MATINDLEAELDEGRITEEEYVNRRAALLGLPPSTSSQEPPPAAEAKAVGMPAASVPVGWTPLPATAAGPPLTAPRPNGSDLEAPTRGGPPYSNYPTSPSVVSPPVPAAAFTTPAPTGTASTHAQSVCVHAYTCAHANAHCCMLML